MSINRRRNWKSSLFLFSLIPVLLAIFHGPFPTQAYLHHWVTDYQTITGAWSDGLSYYVAAALPFWWTGSRLHGQEEIVPTRIILNSILILLFLIASRQAAMTCILGLPTGGRKEKINKTNIFQALIRHNENFFFNSNKQKGRRQYTIKGRDLHKFRNKSQLWCSLKLWLLSFVVVAI